MKRSVSVLYVVAGSSYILLMNHITGYSGAVVKALPILILLGFVATQLSGLWRNAMVLALLFSASGDVFLALNGHDDQWFMAGLGSFLVGQLMYAGLFWSHRLPGFSRSRWVIGSFVFLSFAGMLVVPQAGDFQGPVMLYMLAIGGMLSGAAACNRPLNRLFAGALLFAISDLLIAINKFVLSFDEADILIMTAYYAAQYFIVMGAIAKPSEAPT